MPIKTPCAQCAHTYTNYILILYKIDRDMQRFSFYWGKSQIEEKNLQ